MALPVAGCAPRLMTLPTGPGTPALDGAAVFSEATTVCRAISTFVAQASLGGSVGDQRVRGNLDLGVAAPASARIDLVAPFGQPLFVYAAHDGAATLLLTRENRVVRDADPEALLEALTGIPLGPSALRTTLAGCADDLDASAARQLNDSWRIIENGPMHVYLQRASARGPWRIVAVTRQARDGVLWRAEYRDFENGLPRRIVLFAPDRFRVELALSQIDLKRPLPPEVFRVNIPATATPMTIEELRKSGPLAESNDGQ
jgi:outer membrane biogenesis lipoprotein LolB